MKQLLRKKMLPIAAFLSLIFVVGSCLHVQAQTLNGLLTGTITDPGGAIMPGVQITAVSQVGATRTAVTNDLGVWLIPQLPPGMYKVTAARQGFATIVQDNVQLNVNGSVTLDFKLTVAATNVTVQVTTAPPLLDTTSATISTIVSHQEVVDLPLNGREFMQLALLSPGAAPVENGQQNFFALAEGAGGISPSTDGQRGQSNNFTLDGIENNELFDNAWAISPPPDAIQEFGVQAHMADAQFGVGAGANINVQTRSGSNSFHGDAWEFVRNDDFDATQYPNTTRPFYHQNQYGFYVGGPIIKNHTFFSGYWEGYRFSQDSAVLSNTLTTDEVAGNFSADVGTTVIGTDDNGNPEYANELYDATTSRPDPLNPTETIRDPFPAAGGGLPGRVIPAGILNGSHSQAALDYIKAFYPAPNYPASNPGSAGFPNYEYNGATTTNGDQMGARFDQQLGSNDSVFLRFARNNIHNTGAGSFPTVPGLRIVNYCQEVELGYTHVFDPKTILNVRAAYVYENLFFGEGITSDPALINAMSEGSAQLTRPGVDVPLIVDPGNGLSSISNLYNPLGPSTFYQFNVDASKTVGHHTLTAGGMFFPLRQIEDGVYAFSLMNQAGTAIDGTTSTRTGFSQASLLEGILDSYTPNIQKGALDLTIPWWAFYGQDQWQVNRKLVLTFGTRWDYLATSNYHRQALVFDPFTGKMWNVGTPFTVPSSFLPVGNPTLYQAGQGYFAAKADGWEPRVGVTYQIAKNTVAHLDFGMFDEHNNEMDQGLENIALNWPNAARSNFFNQDIAVPQLYVDTLPTAASLLAASNPSLATNAAQNNPISYTEEYNAGIQQQLANNLSLNVDYVGSVGRHQYVYETGNTAETPGPGIPQLRAQYPQYGPFNVDEDNAPTSYNGLQAKLIRPFAAGATFTASYTWSKSMDYESDPYGDAVPNYYNPRQSWGPSEYNIPQMFVFSGVYQLPFGKGRMFMQTPNKFIQETLGGWQTAGILSLHSGTPTWVAAGGDFANTGWGFEPAQRGTLNPYHKSGGGASGFKQWLVAPTPDTATTLPSSPYAFTEPLQYTLGNGRRNDLTTPDYKDVDFSLQKNFPIWESVDFQFRSEFFNLFNHTNYGGPSTGITSPSSFGTIYGANGNARIIQLSGKIDF